MSGPSGDRLRAGPVEARFTCSRCGREAAHLALFGPGVPEASTGRPPIEGSGLPVLVIQAGWLSMRIGTAALDSLEVGRALAARDAPALYAVDREFAPFWCPTCAAVYCADEWQVWDVFDEEQRWFWEELRGICPEGHERWIYD